MNLDDAILAMVLGGECECAECTLIYGNKELVATLLVVAMDTIDEAAYAVGQE